MFALIPVFVLAGAAWLISLIVSAVATAVMLYIIWCFVRAYPVLKVRVQTRVASIRSKEE